jgi:hypothetical protein
VFGYIRHLEAVVTKRREFDWKFEVSQAAIEQELFKVAAAVGVHGFYDRRVRVPCVPVMILGSYTR